MQNQVYQDNHRSERIAGIYKRGLEQLKENLDPERHLVYQNRKQGTYRPAASLPFAEALLKEGTPASISTAIAITKAVLNSQVTNPAHPHVGNWLWLADDTDIEDLNAVFFVMRSFIPLLVRYDQQLPPDLIQNCQESVHLSLLEIERMELAPAYSNVHLVSLFSLLIGGAWLKDQHFTQLGKKRWDQWVKFTLRSGAPHEYNSPVYGAAELYALTLIQQLTDNPELRLQARILYERVLWHLTLHMHTPTGQLAGPHSRCYWGPMLSGQNGVKDILWRETGWTWLMEPGPYGGHPAMALPGSVDLANLDYWLPAYLIPWLTDQKSVMPYEVRECANDAQGSDLTTYFTKSYALGTASSTYSVGTECFFVEHEANHLMLHYAKPNADEKWGMMYSRFIVNDRHWGTLGAAPDRPKTNNFYDQGHFAGVQHRNKAIALYALKEQHQQVNSLKTVVVFHSGEDIEQVSINNKSVLLSELPIRVHTDDWVIITDGAVHIAVKALDSTQLGLDAPMLLERGPLGELWFTIYNYRGSLKRFWDYASLKGAFWRGNIRAGFVVEVFERDLYPSTLDVVHYLKSALIADMVDKYFIRTITYSSGDDSLTLKYDLWHTKPHSRYLNGVHYSPPQLSSPIAVQGDTGTLQVGHAQLNTNPQPMLLIAQELEQANCCWVAINPENSPTPVRLQTTNGVVTIKEFGLGRLIWLTSEGKEEQLILECLDPPVGVQVPEGIEVITS